MRGFKIAFELGITDCLEEMLQPVGSCTLAARLRERERGSEAGSSALAGSPGAAALLSALATAALRASTAALAAFTRFSRTATVVLISLASLASCTITHDAMAHSTYSIQACAASSLQPTVPQPTSMDACPHSCLPRVFDMPWDTECTGIFVTAGQAC